MGGWAAAPGPAPAARARSAQPAQPAARRSHSHSHSPSNACTAGGHACSQPPPAARAGRQHPPSRACPLLSCRRTLTRTKSFPPSTSRWCPPRCGGGGGCMAAHNWRRHARAHVLTGRLRVHARMPARQCCLCPARHLCTGCTLLSSNANTAARSPMSTRSWAATRSLACLTSSTPHGEAPGPAAPSGISQPPRASPPLNTGCGGPGPAGAASPPA